MTGSPAFDTARQDLRHRCGNTLHRSAWALQSWRTNEDRRSPVRSAASRRTATGSSGVWSGGVATPARCEVEIGVAGRLVTPSDTVLTDFRRGGLGGPDRGRRGGQRQHRGLPCAGRAGAGSLDSATDTMPRAWRTVAPAYRIVDPMSPPGRRCFPFRYRLSGRPAISADDDGASDRHGFSRSSGRLVASCPLQRTDFAVTSPVTFRDSKSTKDVLFNSAAP